MMKSPHIARDPVNEGDRLPQGEDLLEYLCNWLGIGQSVNHAGKVGIGSPAAPISLLD